jgi:hypothetical protein
VIAALARSSVGAEDVRGYVYHYGRGITGESTIGAESLRRVLHRYFRACVDADGATYVPTHLGLSLT